MFCQIFCGEDGRESRQVMTEYKTMKDMPFEEKPYEKFEARGAEALTDAELLAILLRSGTRGSSSLDLARLLLHADTSGGGFLNLYHMSIRELRKIPGIGRVKAIQLKCLLEFSRRIAKETFRKELSFDSPKSIADYYMEDFRHAEQERMMILMLDTKGGFLGEAVIFIGTVNASLVSPREIFLKALTFHAVSVIMIHNHPSGDPTPSEEDLLLTLRVHKAGEMIGIELLDHLVLGDRKYISFREQGFFDKT